MKSVLESLDGVDESLHEHYAEQDGKFVLKLDDDPPGYIKAAQLAETKTKLAQMRDTNIAILKAAGLEDPEDLSPLTKLREEHAALKKAAAELDKKGVKKPEDVEAYLAAKLEEFNKTAVAPLQEQLKQEREAREKAQSAADGAMLRERFTEKLKGAEPTALPFLLDRAAQEFQVAEGGKIEPRAGRLSPKTAAEWAGIDEWVEHAQKEFSFAFKGSAGGGSDPARGGAQPLQGGNKTFRDSAGSELKTDGITVLQ